MKKIIMLSCGILTIFAACRRTPDEVSKTVKVSFPTINVIGSKYITINVGSTYNDSGATLIDDITGQQSKN